jgi:hypothetical protein
LHRVSVAGGESTPLTILDAAAQEGTHRGCRHPEATPRQPGSPTSNPRSPVDCR